MAADSNNNRPISILFQHRIGDVRVNGIGPPAQVQVEEGHAYLELLDRGYTKDEAQTRAQIVGVVNGALERVKYLISDFMFLL